MKTKVSNKQNLEHRTSVRDLRVDFLFGSAQNCQKCTFFSQNDSPSKIMRSVFYFI